MAKYLEICSNNRDRKLYPNPFEFKVRFSNRNTNYITNEIIRSLPILNFYGFDKDTGTIKGGTNIEPLISNGNLYNNYYVGCYFEVNLGNITEKSTIINYNGSKQKCLLSSSLSSIHDNTTYHKYRIINPSSNDKIHIPLENDNYKYIGMYLEDLNILSNKMSDRFKLITDYDHENNLLKLEDGFDAPWQNTDIYRIREKIPLSMGFGYFANGINHNNGVKYVNNKGVTEFKLIEGGTGYNTNSIYNCKLNGNNSLKIKVTSVNADGKIITFEIVDPGNNWNINDVLQIVGGNNDATGSVDNTGFCICLYDKSDATQKDVFGDIYDNENTYLYVINQNETNNKYSYYNELPKYFNLSNSNIVSTNDIVFPISKYILSEEMKWIVLNKQSNINIGNSWEIHQRSYEGFSNIILSNSKYYTNSCYNVRLLKLILPNIEYKNKGYIYQLPYVYVQIKNNNQNYALQSNNPNSYNALFKASIDDCKTTNIKFIKLNGAGTTQSINLSPNEEFLIKILHQDGTVLLSKKIDRVLPYIVDDLLQISLLLEIQKIN